MKPNISSNAPLPARRPHLGCLLLVLALIALLVVGFYLARELTRLRRAPLPPLDPALTLVSATDLVRIPLATQFDFPLGSRHGALAYNAQPFGENEHLGDDLNGIGGKNTDFGDPIHATAHGLVLYTAHAGHGWGNLVLLQHCVPAPDGQRRYYQSLYAHLADMRVVPGETVRRGQIIGSVGNADGLYWAHLHFEIREFTTRFIGAGYRADTSGWLDPTRFIERHRTLLSDSFLPDPALAVDGK